MKISFRKRGLAIQLIPIFIVIVIAFIAFIKKAIDLPTSISIYAVLIAISILLISINEIRNRLRPWVAVNKIDVNMTPDIGQEPTRFYIQNTGPIPATQMVYTARWFIKRNDNWEKVENPSAPAWDCIPSTLFPNQSVVHQINMRLVRELIQAANLDFKVTFDIKYKGLWSKYETTNTYSYNNQWGWIIDNPQDYT